MKIKILKIFENKFGEQSKIPLGLVMENKDREFEFKSDKWSYYVGGDWRIHLQEQVESKEIEIIEQ